MHVLYHTSDSLQILIFHLYLNVLYIHYTQFVPFAENISLISKSTELNHLLKVK